MSLSLSPAYHANSSFVILVPSIFNNLGICVTAVAVIQLPHVHVSVRCIRNKNFSDTQQYTIKKLRIWANGVFPCSKTNMTTICSVIAYTVSGKVCGLNQMQPDQRTSSFALLFDECIATSKGMGITFPTVIVWEEAD